MARQRNPFGGAIHVHTLQVGEKKLLPSFPWVQKVICAGGCGRYTSFRARSKDEAEKRLAEGHKAYCHNCGVKKKKADRAEIRAVIRGIEERKRAIRAKYGECY